MCTCAMTVGNEEQNNTCWLLLSDVPAGTLIGLDANIWRVGPSFRGIRGIPLGVHFLFYNAASSTEGEASSGLRCSTFLNFTKPCVMKKKWVKETEEFTDQPSSDNDVTLMRENQTEVEMYLGRYPRDRFSNWVALSSPHVTNDIVNRLQPTGERIFSCAQFQSERSTSQERANLPIPARLRRDSETSEIEAPANLASGEEQLPDLKMLPETEVC